MVEDSLTEFLLIFMFTTIVSVCYMCVEVSKEEKKTEIKEIVTETKTYIKTHT